MHGHEPEKSGITESGAAMCLAIPGQVVELFPDQPTAALIDVVGVRRKVDLGLLQDNLPVKGDWVLIHVGFAMSKISEEDAIDQMRTLRMLGEAEAAMQEVQGYGLDHTDEHEDVVKHPSEPAKDWV
jgi:hydrogenase expression/formation protein HypC